jgi:hypothetical protein
MTITLSGKWRAIEVEVYAASLADSSVKTRFGFDYVQRISSLVNENPSCRAALDNTLLDLVDSGVHDHHYDVIVDNLRYFGIAPKIKMSA